MAVPERRSMLCPNCRRLISMDESACPYCGTSRPSSWWKNNPWTRGAGSGDRVIAVIITLNIVMYAASLIFSQRPSGQFLNPLSFFTPDQKSLFYLGETGVVAIDRYGRFWTLVSANYLHGGILHILFNMMALRQLAPLVIQEFGASRMLVIYTLGGVFGYVVSYLAGIGYTIGASASVCALIGALLYYGRSRGGVYGQALFREVGGWVVSLFLFGLIFPGINNWGHGGGIVGGALVGMLLGYGEQRRENLFHRLLAGACIVVTLFSLALGMLGALISLGPAIR